MDNASLFFLISGIGSNESTLNNLMIFGAEYLIYLTLVGMFIIALRGKVNDKKALLLVCLSLPIIIIIIKLIHIFYYEPRPYVSFDITPLVEHKEDASFPSRHISIMAAVSFAFMYFKSKYTPLLLFFTLWVGFARIYVGVHYPLDIIGGIVVGIISLVAALQIRKLLKLHFLS